MVNGRDVVKGKCIDVEVEAVLFSWRCTVGMVAVCTPLSFDSITVEYQFPAPRPIPCAFTLITPKGTNDNVYSIVNATLAYSRSPLMLPSKPVYA